MKNPIKEKAHSLRWMAIVCLAISATVMVVSIVKAGQPEYSGAVLPSVAWICSLSTGVLSAAALGFLGLRRRMRRGRPDSDCGESVR